MEYEPVIGLEVHIQVKTQSKMFCSCAADYFGAEPNSHICPVCLGLPGALPVPNKLAIDKCIMLGLALNCQINHESKFDRKNYFYPDLPKGFQISQYDDPLGYQGFLEFDLEGDSRRIRITRVHLEEDTGKSLHNGKETLLDFNKSGVPLIEVVTEPDFQSIKEVTSFSKRLRQLVRYLDISAADMEKGQMRFELNISLRTRGAKELPDYKVEVKNISSISVLEKVINFEITRQQELFAKKLPRMQETRGLRDLSGKTYSQRIKEVADDYRYFPEPDIPPLYFSESEINNIAKRIPELPQEKKARYFKEFGLECNTAEVLISSRTKALWFEKSVAFLVENKYSGDDLQALAREIAKWLIGDVTALLKADKIKLKDLKFSPQALANLILLMKQKKLSGSLAKQVLLEMYKTGQDPGKIIHDKNLNVVSDTKELAEIVHQVISENPKLVADFVKNPHALKFLLGQVMRKTKGQADPEKTQKILQEFLQK